MRASVLLFSVCLASVGCGSSKAGEAPVVTDAVASDGGAESGGDAGAESGVITAGTPCTTLGSDPACGDLLQCAESQVGPICSADCENGGQTLERDQCGPTSTCLKIGDAPTDRGNCAATCSGSRPCAAGFLCTGFWYTHANDTADFLGCYPFCTADAECAGGKKCDVRKGTCGASATDLTLLADGAPCDPAATTPPCRGICFHVSAKASEGICGSMLEHAPSTSCPDPGVQPLTATGDSLALCIFKDCTTNADCTAPLICRYDEDASGTVVGSVLRCNYPTASQPTGP